MAKAKKKSAVKTKQANAALAKQSGRGKKQSRAKTVSKANTKTAGKFKAKKSNTDVLLKLGKNIWPAERDVLFRPDRYKYVRKMIKPEGCVFCNAAKAGVEFDSLCIYQTKHSMIVLNKFPYNSGHILVLPRKHIGDLLELSQDEYDDLHQLLREAVKAVRQVYEPAGLNVGLNQGAVSGAGIPDHLHYHVIPRWAGDLNFFPLIAETKTVIESLEMSFERLLTYFKSFKE